VAPPATGEGGLAQLDPTCGLHVWLTHVNQSHCAQGKGRAPSVMVDAATSVFRLGCDAVDLLQLAASQASVPPPLRDAKHGEPLGRQSQASCSLVPITAFPSEVLVQNGMRPPTRHACTHDGPERT